MCDLGISPENFNPEVLYIFKRKYAGNDSIKYHSHDFASLIYILSGSCTYTISGKEYHVKKGDLILLNPGVFHGKVLLAGEEVQEFHTGFNNLSIRNLPKKHIIDEDMCPVINLSKYDYDFIRSCNDILAEQERNEPGFELMLKVHVMKLIILILRTIYCEYKNENEVKNRDTSNLGAEPYDRINIVNNIVSFINDNYMKEISLEKISRNTYLSPVYISKIFKEETGDSPINYLIKTRLMKARELLEEGKLSIKAAAKSVGYHDAYYFSKLFKKYYGYPPSKINKYNQS